jgi:hypothetical protein
MTGNELADKQGDEFNFRFEDDGSRSYLMVGVGDSDERVHYEAEQ